MPSHSQSKGKRGEREIVSLARECGLEAQRTWETAQHPRAEVRACDVRIGGGRPFQVKRLKGGFGRLYEALQGVEGMFLRTDGGEWLAVVPAREYLRLMAANRRVSEGAVYTSENE
jgi:Holliday junction resolvase